MKFLIVFFLGLFLSCAYGIDPEQARDMMIQMSEECREKEGASKEDVIYLADKNLPETDKQKCLATCLQEQFNMVEDNKFSVEGFLRISKMVAEDDEEKYKNAELLAEDCKETKTDNRCELALLIFKCLKENAEKRGIKYDDM